MEKIDLKTNRIEDILDYIKSICSYGCVISVSAELFQVIKNKLYYGCHFTDSFGYLYGARIEPNDGIHDLTIVIDYHYHTTQSTPYYYQHNLTNSSLYAVSNTSSVYYDIGQSINQASESLLSLYGQLCESCSLDND